MQAFDAVSGERRRRCGCGAVDRAPLERGRAVQVGSLLYEGMSTACYLCLCLYRYLRRLLCCLYIHTTCFLLAVVHCSEAGGERRHATLFSQQRPSDPTGRERSWQKQKGARQDPRAGIGTQGPLRGSLLAPAPIHTDLYSTYRWVPKSVLPTHANALQEPEPRRLQWRSNPARSTVAGAGLPPQQRLRPHGRSTFSLAGETWRLHQRRCHSVTVFFF